MRANEGLRVAADADELARIGAEHVLACARERLRRSAQFHLALAGGSTPRAAYALLAARADVDFGPWHLWFGDERCVPPDHPDSNFGMARRSGLVARIDPERLHRLQGEAPEPSAEAGRYERELCAALGAPPRLDLVLLGLGADGHTASLFPGSDALESPDWVAVGSAPKPPERRLTLTFRTLSVARSIAFLVSGADKAAALADILQPSHAGELPARRAYPEDGSLQWLVDRPAAGGGARPGGG